MSFTVDDFQDRVRLLEERPDWRVQLRRFVLTDALLALPEQVADLRAATERRFQELAEAQHQTERRVRELAEAQQKLAEAQQRTAEQLQALAESHLRLEKKFEDLGDTVRVLAKDMGEVKGKLLEIDYRVKGHAYFSRVIRRSHVLSSDEITALLDDAVERGVLSDEQAQDLSQADVIVRGKRREDRAEVYLVVGVSWGVGPHDVTRAIQRATSLARTGVTAIPVVAGTWVTPEADLLARQSQTWQITDGRAIPPESLSS